MVLPASVRQSGSLWQRGRNQFRILNKNCYSVAGTTIDIPLCFGHLRYMHTSPSKTPKPIREQSKVVAAETTQEPPEPTNDGVNAHSTQHSPTRSLTSREASDALTERCLIHSSLLLLLLSTFVLLRLSCLLEQLYGVA